MKLFWQFRYFIPQNTTGFVDSVTAEHMYSCHTGLPLPNVIRQFMQIGHSHSFRKDRDLYSHSMYHSETT
jgi:hypothetical protein